MRAPPLRATGASLEPASRGANPPASKRQPSTPCRSAPPGTAITASSPLSKATTCDRSSTPSMARPSTSIS